MAILMTGEGPGANTRYDPKMAFDEAILAASQSNKMFSNIFKEQAMIRDDNMERAKLEKTGMIAADIAAGRLTSLDGIDLSGTDPEMLTKTLMDTQRFNADTAYRGNMLQKQTKQMELQAEARVEANRFRHEESLARMERDANKFTAVDYQREKDNARKSTVQIAGKMTDALKGANQAEVDTYIAEVQAKGTIEEKAAIDMVVGGLNASNSRDYNAREIQVAEYNQALGGGDPREIAATEAKILKANPGITGKKAMSIEKLAKEVEVAKKEKTKDYTAINKAGILGPNGNLSKWYNALFPGTEAEVEAEGIAIVRDNYNKKINKASRKDKKKLQNELAQFNKDLEGSTTPEDVARWLSKSKKAALKR